MGLPKGLATVLGNDSDSGYQPLRERELFSGLKLIDGTLGGTMIRASDHALSEVASIPGTNRPLALDGSLFVEKLSFV